jgi:hypothetical protein
VTSKPKQIVLDKCAFQGINLAALCEFAKYHPLLLSDALLYECASSPTRLERKYLDRYEKLIRTGAFYCSTTEEYIKWEGSNSCAYPRWLADVKQTECVRTQVESLEELCDSRILATAKQPRCSMAHKMFVEMSKKVSDRINSGRLDMAMHMKNLPKDRLCRFREWFRGIDKSTNVRGRALELLPSAWIKDASQVCVSPEWMTWHHIRLLLAVQREYAYLCLTGGPRSDNCAEHDYQDMEYVFLLSRADGIITRDKKLVEPLARAAFPEKDVFSSLEEVPDSYRCDWTEA